MDAIERAGFLFPDNGETEKGSQAPTTYNLQLIAYSPYAIRGVR